MQWHTRTCKRREKALKNIDFLLKDNGFIFIQLVNPFSVEEVIGDGHYNIPGISLIKHIKLQKEYAKKFIEQEYDVEEGYTFNIDSFISIMKEINPNITIKILNTIEERDYNNLIKESLIKIKSINGLKEETTKYIEQMQKDLKDDKKNALLKYGVRFWQIVCKKIKWNLK